MQVSKFSSIQAPQIVNVTAGSVLALESTVFSLPFFKYHSKVQTVSEKKFRLDPKKSNSGINFLCIAPITREGRKNAFLL